jgi:ribosomal-protein-alanine N-acetyltransferase
MNATPVPLELRTPTRADYEVLATWITDAQACLRWAGPRVPFPFAAADLEAHLVTPHGGGSHVLAHGQGAPVAFSQHWQAVAGAVHLGRLIVAPASRGGGVGRLLVQKTISLASRRFGVGIVTLRVYRDNTTALGLYRSLQFAEDPSSSDDETAFMRAEVGRALAAA